MAVETERAQQTTQARTGTPAPPPEDGRRLATAGRALAVMALALLLAALLNAQSIYKSVFNQQEGTQREVALAFAGPLRQVSMALRMDRPRAWCENAIGREHATIDTAIVLPPPPPPTATTPGIGPVTPTSPIVKSSPPRAGPE